MLVDTYQSGINFSFGNYLDDIQTPTNISILKNEVSILLDFHAHCYYY